MHALREVVQDFQPVQILHCCTDLEEVTASRRYDAGVGLACVAGQNAEIPITDETRNWLLQCFDSTGWTCAAVKNWISSGGNVTMWVDEMADVDDPGDYTNLYNNYEVSAGSRLSPGIVGVIKGLKSLVLG